MTQTQGLQVGDRVRHSDSGWTGTVATVHDDDGGAGQGPLVTIDPVEAGGKTWAPMTVTTDELERL